MIPKMEIVDTLGYVSKQFCEGIKIGSLWIFTEFLREAVKIHSPKRIHEISEISEYWEILENF